jgi:hypothetical protein
VTLPRFSGTVILAEPRKSYLVRLDDVAWKLVRLSRREGNRTNYRMRVGDRITFSIAGTIAGTARAINPTLLNVSRHRKPIRPPPPYYTLGPVIRVGVRMPVNAT